MTSAWAAAAGGTAGGSISGASDWPAGAPLALGGGEDVVGPTSGPGPGTIGTTDDTVF